MVLGIRIFDKSDHRFCELHLTLETVSSKLHRSGLGLTKIAEVITVEVEAMLWERGILGL